MTEGDFNKNVLQNI